MLSRSERESNIPPLVMELDSTFRGRFNSGNFLPGNFMTNQTIQSNADHKSFDPISSSAPIKYWRGANFKQNYIIKPGEFNNDNYLCVKPIAPTSITNPLPDNELGFAGAGYVLYIQAANSDGSGVPISDSQQNSLHTELNYYSGSVLATIDSSNNISGRTRCLTYKYLGNNNAVCIVDIPISFDLDSDITLCFLDPTDFTNINNPYIFVPGAPFLENHYSHFKDVDGAEAISRPTGEDLGNFANGDFTPNNTNIIFNHCTFQYRPIKARSYNKNSHVLQINTTSGNRNSFDSGPIFDLNNCTDLSFNPCNWYPWHIYSIREQPPLFCGGMTGEEIESPPDPLNAFSYTKYNNGQNIPLFLTTKTLTGAAFPPKRLPELDAKFDKPGKTTLYNSSFLISPSSRKFKTAAIFDYEVLGEGANKKSGAFIEIQPLRCVDMESNGDLSFNTIYKLDIIPPLSPPTDNIYDTVAVSDPSQNISDFIDYYRSCKLRFSVTDSSGAPVFDSPFYGAERVITSYDPTNINNKLFKFQEGIFDPNGDIEDGKVTANIICDHSCTLPEMNPQTNVHSNFTINKPNDFRRIKSFIFLDGSDPKTASYFMNDPETMNGRLHYTIIIPDILFKGSGLAVASDLGTFNKVFSDLYLLDLDLTFPPPFGNNNNICVNMIERVTDIVQVGSNWEITFTAHADDNTSVTSKWGYKDHHVGLSSGKTFIIEPKTGFNYKLGNQNFCILKITQNMYHPIENQIPPSQEPVSYEITLCDVVLPNIVLDSYFGGRISAYRYFYVVLNYSSSATSTAYSLRSNNKFAPAGVVFRVAVERQFTDESSKYFLSFTSKCPMYAKFNVTKPIRFSVILPNGETFKNAVPEWYGPCKPNPLIQISASFSFRRRGNVGIMENNSRNSEMRNSEMRERQLRNKILRHEEKIEYLERKISEVMPRQRQFRGMPLQQQFRDMPLQRQFRDMPRQQQFRGDDLSRNRNDDVEIRTLTENFSMPYMK